MKNYTPYQGMCIYIPCQIFVFSTPLMLLNSFRYIIYQVHVSGGSFVQESTEDQTEQKLPRPLRTPQDWTQWNGMWTWTDHPQ